jgi:hypothetical protein
MKGVWKNGGVVRWMEVVRGRSSHGVEGYGRELGEGVDKALL